VSLLNTFDGRSDDDPIGELSVRRGWNSGSSQTGTPLQAGFL